MMEQIPFRIEEKDRVRIKADVTSVYPMARAYMEGDVIARQRDEMGYPMILVKWDKNHWAYSGEQDGWTMESHFDVVKREEKVSEKDRMEQFKDSLMNGIISAFAAYEDAVEEEEDIEEVDDDGPRSYEETLKRAVECAEEGDAFIIIVAHREKETGHNIVIPAVFSNNKSSVSEILLEATLSELGANMHSQSAMREIQKLKEDQDQNDKR